MKKSVPKSVAEQRVMRKYDKLYVPLVELAHALQDLEPGGTTVSEAEFTVKDGTAHIEYKAHPVMVTIVEGSRKFSLRMDDIHADSLG
ncbi:hypothetical protein [Nocardia brasiliensis]|uniref:hypothetical protein n=1 Tax=Nocardia brasiliensis TaxID=37326 RepID=UPI002458C721|nr:hypothetical protein [Nocardia brasiliensis]